MKTKLIAVLLLITSIVWAEGVDIRTREIGKRIEWGIGNEILVIHDMQYDSILCNTAAEKLCQMNTVFGQKVERVQADRNIPLDKIMTVCNQKSDVLITSKTEYREHYSDWFGFVSYFPIYQTMIHYDRAHQKIIMYPVTMTDWSFNWISFWALVVIIILLIIWFAVAPPPPSRRFGTFLDTEQDLPISVTSYMLILGIVTLLIMKLLLISEKFISGGSLFAFWNQVAICFFGFLISGVITAILVSNDVFGKSWWQNRTLRFKQLFLLTELALFVWVFVYVVREQVSLGYACLYLMIPVAYWAINYIGLMISWIPKKLVYRKS